MKTDTRQIKTALPMGKLLEHYQAVKTSVNQYWCISHEQGGRGTGHKTPSLALHPNSQTISCMSQRCFEGENIFGVIAKQEGLDIKKDYPKVLKIAAGIAGVQIEDAMPQQKKSLKFINLTDEHSLYLKKRGLEQETISKMSLASSYDHILFLYYDREEVSGYKAKTIIPKKMQDEHKKNNPKWLSYYIKPKKHDIWTVGGIHNKKIIYLVAGEYDTAILYQEVKKKGLEDEIGVVTLTTGETTAISSNILKFFTTLTNIEWRIIYDFDDTGLDNAPIRAKELSATGRKVSMFRWEDAMNPNKKAGYDINDYFLEIGNIDIFLDLKNFQEFNEGATTIDFVEERYYGNDTAYVYKIDNYIWELIHSTVKIRDSNNKIIYEKKFNTSLIISDKTQSALVRDLVTLKMYNRNEARMLILSLAARFLNDKHPDNKNVQEEVKLLDRDIDLEEIHAAISKIGVTSKELIEIEMAASISCALNLNVPLWLLVIGNPSSLKTEGLKLFRCLDKERVIYLSTMSENAFASGYMPPDGSDPKDLLTILDKKILLIRDLTTLFSLNEETVKKILGDLTSIFDGEFEKFTATRGLMKYKAAFPLIACITPAILSKHHNYVNQLGSRFLTYRIPNLTEADSKRGYDIAWNNEDRSKNIKTAAILVSSFCDRIIKRFDAGAPLPTIDDNLVREWLNDGAEFIRRVRGIAITKAETFKNEDGKDITFYDRLDTQIEEPWRALNQLRNYAIALAVLRNKIAVSMDECRTLLPLVRSAAQIDRAEVLNALIDNAGITINELSKKIDRSSKTTSRKLIELEMLGLVFRYHSPNMPSGSKAPWLWSIESKFSRLLEKQSKVIPPSSEFMSIGEDGAALPSLLDDIKDKNSEEGGETT